MGKIRTKRHSRESSAHDVLETNPDCAGRLHRPASDTIRLGDREKRGPDPRTNPKFRHIFPFPALGNRRTILIYWRTLLFLIFLPDPNDEGSSSPIRASPSPLLYPSLSPPSLVSSDRLHQRLTSPLENMEQLEGKWFRFHPMTDDAFLENSQPCARQLFWFPHDVAANLNESSGNIGNMHNTIHNWNTDPARLSFQLGKGQLCCFA